MMIRKKSEKLRVLGELDRVGASASSLRDQKGEVRLASSHVELKIGYIFTCRY
jgi:hypothetical protein